MSWNITFPYNDAVIRLWLRAPGHREERDGADAIHLQCLRWLDNLQEGRDYAWSLRNNNRITCIFCEYLYFNKEEDLLAFRLACGL